MSDIQSLQARFGPSRIKLAAASLAYAPLAAIVLAFGLYRAGIVSERVAKGIFFGCGIFNFPAIALMRVIDMFHPGPAAWMLSSAALFLGWSSVMAALFWRGAGTFLGEDEPPEQHGKFDWIRFQVRFFFGFIIGFLVGWRVVKYSTSNATLLTACCLGGIIGGFGYGLSQPRNFWSRP